MKTSIQALSLAAILCSMGMSCSKNNGSNSSSKPLLSLSANSTVGSTIIVDSSGRSVYNFIFDAQGSATCLSGCAVVWPHEYFKGLQQSNLGTGLNIADFSTVTNADGSMQTTYKGHPLYIFSGDADSAGIWSVTGNNIEGGTWFAGQPDFTVFVSNNKKSTGMDSAYLTTPTGMALYVTTAVTPDASLVAFKTSSTLDLPARLSNSDFSVNGSGILAYKGAILYTCTADTKAGQINGSALANTSLVLLP